VKEKARVQRSGKLQVLKKKCGFLAKLRNTGANPIYMGPMQKFWSWQNYDKSLFQFYKAVFITQNYAKRHFWG
jgi:hypothetical protein